MADEADPPFDDDNPEWTQEMFDRARRPQDVLPASVLDAFPRTRGLQQSPVKVPISIRLSSDVIEHFRATGPGWQSRIDETLKKAISGN